MNCGDEHRLVSVVTRAEHHHARGGLRSGDGDGLGKVCLASSVVVGVLSWLRGVCSFTKNNKERKTGPKGHGQVCPLGFGVVHLVYGAWRVPVLVHLCVLCRSWIAQTCRVTVQTPRSTRGLGHPEPMHFWPCFFIFLYFYF